jgi:hypothetical protein
MNGYWITEFTTYKITADSEAEAAKVWQQFWDEGKPWTELPMSVKDGGVEADWDWEQTDE